MPQSHVFIPEIALFKYTLYDDVSDKKSIFPVLNVWKWQEPIGNHSNGARWDWQAICMSVYRKQGCSMPCKHLQKWTARFEPHVSEGSNTFSVTLIKIRRKNCHWNLQEKYIQYTRTHTLLKFPQSKSVQTYPRGSSSSFLPISTPFVLCHLFLIQPGKLIKHILYIPPSPQSHHPSCIPNLTNPQWNHLQGFKSIAAFMKGGSGSSLN